VLFAIFLFWYQKKYAMGVAESYHINSPQLQKTLLIATQESNFKHKVIAGVVDYYKADSLFIQVVDISSLDTTNIKKYNAVFIIHTWETWNPPIAVKNFINRTKKDTQKMVVFTTSGDGKYKMEGVDAITGESKLVDVLFYIDKITSKLNLILKLEE
jgi:hypothetical protein